MAYLQTMTPEYIQGKLFSFHDRAHKLHLDTRSYAEHKALDTLYTELVDFKDNISEKIQGYTGKIIGKIKSEDIPSYSQGEPVKLVKEIAVFSKLLEDWAKSNNYCDIENIAQELSGLAAKINYLLMLR